MSRNLNKRRKAIKRNRKKRYQAKVRKKGIFNIHLYGLIIMTVNYVHMYIHHHTTYICMIMQLSSQLFSDPFSSSPSYCTFFKAQPSWFCQITSKNWEIYLIRFFNKKNHEDFHKVFIMSA